MSLNVINGYLVLMLTTLVSQLIRLRSKTGTVRHELQPNDDISVLIQKVG